MTSLLLTSDGLEVVLAHKHLRQHAEIIPHINDVLGHITMGDQTFLCATVNLGKVVGHTAMVETSDTDEVVWAQRQGRKWRSRFVKNREMPECQHITVMLSRQRGPLTLFTGWVGYEAPPELDDPRIGVDVRWSSAEAVKRCQDFWATHALVWGSQKIIKSTITRKV